MAVFQMSSHSICQAEKMSLLHVMAKRFHCHQTLSPLVARWKAKAKTKQSVLVSFFQACLRFDTIIETASHHRHCGTHVSCPPCPS